MLLAERPWQRCAWWSLTLEGGGERARLRSERAQRCGSGLSGHGGLRGFQTSSRRRGAAPEGSEETGAKIRVLFLGDRSGCRVEDRLEELGAAGRCQRKTGLVRAGAGHGS